MNRRRVVFFLFVIFVSVAAVLVTTTSAPAPPAEEPFNTPTLTPTNTATTLPTATTFVLPTAQSTSTDETNCTYSYLIWRQYPEAWGLSSIRIGNSVYSTQQVLVILDSSEQDAHTRLLQQLFALVINQRKGADPSVIIDTLNQATEWITVYPQGSELSEDDKLAGLNFAKQLELYNGGAIGPGICTRSIETPTPTRTNTPEASSTPTMTRTPVATATSVVPTARPVTPTATNRPDRPRPPRPTQPPPPQPTDPPPPTEPPPPPTIAPPSP